MRANNWVQATYEINFIKITFLIDSNLLRYFILQIYLNQLHKEFSSYIINQDNKIDGNKLGVVLDTYTKNNSIAF